MNDLAQLHRPDVEAQSVPGYLEKRVGRIG
jgi:hypothetical protein